MRYGDGSLSILSCNLVRTAECSAEILLSYLLSATGRTLFANKHFTRRNAQSIYKVCVGQVFTTDSE